MSPAWYRPAHACLGLRPMGWDRTATQAPAFSNRLAVAPPPRDRTRKACPMRRRQGVLAALGVRSFPPYTRNFGSRIITQTTERNRP